MRVRRTAAQIVSCSQFVRKIFISSARIFIVTSFSTVQLKRVSRVMFILHGSVGLVVSWLFEHGGACVEWTQLVNLQ